MWSPVGALPTPLANGALCFTDGFVNPGGADVLMYEPATGDWTLATALSFLDERSMLTAVVGNGPGFPLDGCLVFTGPFVYRTSALSVLLIYRPTPDPAAGAMPGTLTDAGGARSDLLAGVRLRAGRTGLGRQLVHAVGGA
jgi:hypothetical protein